MTFLLELGMIGLFVFILSFFISILLIGRTDNIFVVFGPMIIIGFLWVGVMYLGTEEASDSLELFCLDKGFSDSKFIHLNESYCLDQENSYLIEQEVRIVNDEWLLIKSSLSIESDNKGDGDE